MPTVDLMPAINYLPAVECMVKFLVLVVSL